MATLKNPAVRGAELTGTHRNPPEPTGPQCFPKKDLGIGGKLSICCTRHGRAHIGVSGRAAKTKGMEIE